MLTALDSEADATGPPVESVTVPWIAAVPPCAKLGTGARHNSKPRPRAGRAVLRTKHTHVRIEKVAEFMRFSFSFTLDEATCTPKVV